MARQPLSLRARAVALLAQRDHSELELRRKLGRIARDAQQQQQGQGQGQGRGLRMWPDHDHESDQVHDPESNQPPDEVDPLQCQEQVEDVLLWLRQQGYLDESRFVESRLNARSSRWGQRRIEQELAQHGLSLDAEQRSTLSETELARACEVLRRKFGSAVHGDVTQEARQMLEARQMRFLIGRGFQSDLARRAIRAVRAESAAAADPETDR